MQSLRQCFAGGAALPGKFGQDVLWNMASLGVLAMCGVIMNVIIARWYDSAALGVFNQVYAAYVVFSQFAVAGVHLSALKHVAQHAHQPELHRAIFVAALVLSAGLAGAAAVLFWLLRGQMAAWMDSAGVEYGVACAAPGLFFFS